MCTGLSVCTQAEGQISEKVGSSVWIQSLYNNRINIQHFIIKIQIQFSYLLLSNAFLVLTKEDQEGSKKSGTKKQDGEFGMTHGRCMGSSFKISRAGCQILKEKGRT